MVAVCFAEGWMRKKEEFRQHLKRELKAANKDIARQVVRDFFNHFREIRVAGEQAILIKKDGSGFIKADTVFSEITTRLIQGNGASINEV